MATRLREEVQILCYPKTQIPYRKNSGFVVSDILGDHMTLSGGDNEGMSIQGQNPTISLPYLNAGEASFTALDNVDFVRFLKDGTMKVGASIDSAENSELAGIVLQARIALLDCKMQDAPVIVDTDNFDLNWESVQGKHKTVLPPESPQRTHIINSGSDLTAKVRTVGNIPANRSLQFDVHFSALKPSGPQGRVRIIWGGIYSLVAQHGMKWTVEKLVDGVWRIPRKLDSLPPVNMQGMGYQIQVRHLAGRLVISLGDKHFHFKETEKKPSQRAPVVKNSDWPAAQIQVNAFNARVRIGIALIKYADADDVPFTGLFKRTYDRKTNVTSEMVTTAGGSGWKAKEAGGTITVVPTIAPSQLSYACNLTAGASGIETPFVNKIMISSEPQWEYPTSDALDIAPATLSLTVDMAMPPIMSGAECSLTVDRMILDELDSAWEGKVNKRNPVEIRTRSHYDNDTTGAWVNLFSGYVFKRDKAHPKFGDHAMSLTFRDPSMRLQAPAAVIDHRYPPLDFEFIKKLATGEATALYGSDCVKSILSIAISPHESQRLNGGSDISDQGNRYFNSHYALLDLESDQGGYLAVMAVADAIGGTAPTINGFQLPPKFGDDALKWINDIALMDHAIFYYGRPFGWTGYPVPMYGRILNIISGRPTWIIPDLKYAEGDQNKVMLSADVSHRPERDVNRVLVWGSAPPGLEELVPALFMGESRLPANDVNAPEHDWERTLVIRESVANFPGLAQDLADAVISELAGREMEFPQLTMRGQATLSWGDKLQTREEGVCPDISDTNLGLEGKTFRVEKLQHQFEFDKSGGAEFTTTAWVRPLSAYGW